MERAFNMFRNYRASRIALAVASACAAGLAHGQDDLQETIVTATRTPQPIDAVGKPVIVITRSDIERSLAGDVSEILQQYAGLEIARNGGPGQTTSLFTRGTDSNHTVVLVDGVRINPGTIGGAALQNIAPESLERIEIVKGPGSSLYGTDAIGGVVQVFTRGAEQDGISAGASYGSDATQQLFGDAAFSAGKVKFGFGGSYAESDGMPTYDFSSDDRGYRNVTGRATFEANPTDEWAVRARAWRTTGRTEYTDVNFFLPVFPPATAPVSQDFETSVYSVETEYRGDEFGIRGTLSQARDAVDQNEPNFLGDLDFAHTRRNTLDLQADLPAAGEHLISVGVQHSAENTRALSFGTAFDEDTRVTQGFVQDQFTHGWFNARAAVGYVDHDTFGGEVTWNAELGATFNDTRVSLLGGKAFRAPDSTDRFGFGGNPDLQPEISEQVEIAVRQKFGAGQQLALSAFDNRIQDLINFVITDPMTFDGRNENVDRARIKGVELGYRFIGKAWRVRADLVFQDPRDETTDERLLRRSREALTVAVNRDVGPLDVGVDLQSYGNRKDFGGVNLEPYTLVGAAVRYRVTAALTVQGRIDNAFDEDYVLAQGYLTEGRSYNIGVRYSFE